MKKVGSPTLFIFSILFFIFNSCKEAPEYADLQIQVLTLQGGNKVRDAHVSVYANARDYRDQLNAVDSGRTNHSGIIIFPDLHKDISYYIFAKSAGKTSKNPDAESRNQQYRPGIPKAVPIYIK